VKIVKPIKWHGGKHYLSAWIISHFPPHLHYVEPYFGGGSVLLHRDPDRDWFIDAAWRLKNGEKIPSELRGCSEVVNDINFHLTNFWNTLKSPKWFTQFKRQIEMTPLSEWEFNKAGIMLKGGDAVGPISAAAFFVRARQSRQGLMKDFATLTRNRTRGRISEQASAWLGAIDGLLDVHARIQSVVILCGPALKVIQQQDGPNTLFYCDPPYLPETRSSNGEYGENEMALEDHVELLTLLADLKGKFILSGYPSKLYRLHQVRNGWFTRDKKIDNKASSKKTKKKMIERLWMNFQPGLF